jgi:tetratricopeptide (TPR) repeat protein
LAARGVAVHPDELVDMVYLPERQGSVPLEMVAAARRYGMLVYPLPQRLEAVVEEVAAGNPVLVLQNLGLSWWPRWHYAVVVGYDLAASELVLRSGETERYVMPMGLFETTWRRGDSWAQVVLPPGRVPVTAEPLPYLQAVLALEQSRQEAAALEGYRAATGRWPETPLGWLARGNLAYRLGNYREAEASFRGGVRGTPEEAALWNNLGYVLAERGCIDEARGAVFCAMALAPDNAAYRESLQDLQGTAVAAEGCEPVVCPSVTEERGGSLSSTP